MRKEGTIVLTSELQGEVDQALREAATKLGMTIEEFSVIAHFVIKDWHKDSNMEIEVDD